MHVYALSPVPYEAARFYSDVHLRPGCMTIAKILSDSMHHASQKSLIVSGDTVVKKMLGGSEDAPTFWLKGEQLLPPSKNVNVWSKWAAMNRINAWWLVDLSFMLSKEYMERFKLPSPHPDHMRIQHWATGGLINSLPTPPQDRPVTTLRDEFPVSIPAADVLKMDESARLSVVNIYRQFYLLQKSKVRMKWTDRDRPSFMDSNEASCPF